MICLKALKGVGDDKRGLIPDERGDLSYQVRRRLSVKEEAQIPGGACDVRRTAEAHRRWHRAERWIDPRFRHFALDELNSETGI